MFVVLAFVVCVVVGRHLLSVYRTLGVSTGRFDVSVNVDESCVTGLGGSVAARMLLGVCIGCPSIGVVEVVAKRKSVLLSGRGLRVSGSFFLRGCGRLRVRGGGLLLRIKRLGNRLGAVGGRTRIRSGTVYTSTDKSSLRE